MIPLPSMPLWYKRAGPMLPANTVNESDIIAFNGRLLCAIFSRPPLAQEVQFWDISDPINPTLVSKQPWAGAMGSMLVDASGVLHLYGSSPPAGNNPPYNSIIHSAVNPGWTLAASNTIIGPSGMGFNNIAVAALPGGYVLAVEQAYSNGNKAESYIISSTADFASYTVKSAFYNPGTPTTDFTGRSRIRWNQADGYAYVTSDSLLGYTKIARTRDFTTFEFSTKPYGFLGPDFGDAFNGTVGGSVFYNGNASWEQVVIGGQTVVVAIFFEGNESNYAAIHEARFAGDLQFLFAQFF